MKHTRAMAALVALLCGAAWAGPNDFSGKAVVTPNPGVWYVSGFGGWSGSGDNENYAGLIAAKYSADVSFNTGTIFGGAIGYEFGENLLGVFRMEVEGSYRDFEAKSTAPFVDASLAYKAVSPIHGDVTKTDVLVNIVQDFDLGWSPFRPFLGAGFGVAMVDTDLALTPAGRTYVINGSDTVFAWQLSAGLELAITEGLKAYGEYRVMGNGATTVPLTSSVVPATTGTMSSDSLWSQHLILGLRLLF
jgi:opacity protein-like surface antigen